MVAQNRRRGFFFAEGPINYDINKYTLIYIIEVGLKKMNALPKELAQIVFNYYDPWKENHKRKQKKIIQTLTQAGITRDYVIKNYVQNIGAMNVFNRNSFLYPSVKDTKKNIITYKTYRTRITKYLKNN